MGRFTQHLKNTHESTERLKVTLLSTHCGMCNSDSLQYCKYRVNGAHTSPTDAQTAVQKAQSDAGGPSSQLTNNKKPAASFHNLNT